MKFKIAIFAFLITVSAISAGQSETEINKTDPQGRKQGHWIKKYPNENVMYDGFFKDNLPVGEMRRYNPDKSLLSVLVYNDKGTEATVTIYHPNGSTAIKGKYLNQKKEGPWQFYSEFIKGYLLSEEHYIADLRNGPSIKFYPDSTVAERLNFIKDLRQGEWIQYYSNGKPCLKSNYLNGKINGKFEVWFDNGNIEFSGQYKNDVRDGLWYIYNRDGTLKYTLEYIDGITKDRKMDIDESDNLDFLEKNKGKIADPEKTGTIW